MTGHLRAITTALVRWSELRNIDCLHVVEEKHRLFDFQDDKSGTSEFSRCRCLLQYVRGSNTSVAGQGYSRLHDH